MGGGPQYREAGGGPATGLANDFINFLQQGLQTGSFGGVSSTQRLQGTDPVGATGGIAGVLNDILSGGAGNLGGSLGQMISRDVDRQAGAVRSRFGASGGTAFGTPAAYAESLVRSESAPRIATAVGGLQLQALSQILPILAGMSSKGIAQREGYLQPNQTASTIASLAPIVSGGLGLLAGNPLAALPAAGGGGGGGSAGMFNIPQGGLLNGGGLFQNLDPRIYNFGV